MHHAEQLNIHARSRSCPGIEAHSHRWPWQAFCLFLPSTLSCTTSLPLSGVTRCPPSPPPPPPPDWGTGPDQSCLPLLRRAWVRARGGLEPCMWMQFMKPMNSVQTLATVQRTKAVDHFPSPGMCLYYAAGISTLCSLPRMKIDEQIVRCLRCPSLGFDSLNVSQVYTIYSILCIVFVILIIVTAFITVALTYFQLAVEDHRWWWRSFLCGGSTGMQFFGLAQMSFCLTS